MYQKAYVEFFVSPEKLEGLEQRLQQQSSITYMAINSKGKVRILPPLLPWQTCPGEISKGVNEITFKGLVIEVCCGASRHLVC